MRVPADAKLVVIVAGDEAGEAGSAFAQAFRDFGYHPSALAMMLNVAVARGRTVSECAASLCVPLSTVTIDQFSDPYQVPRVLAALLDAPVGPAAAVQSGWVERVMKTPLLRV